MIAIPAMTCFFSPLYKQCSILPLKPPPPPPPPLLLIFFFFAFSPLQLGSAPALFSMLAINRRILLITGKIKGIVSLKLLGSQHPSVFRFRKQKNGLPLLQYKRHGVFRKLDYASYRLCNKNGANIVLQKIPKFHFVLRILKVLDFLSLVSKPFHFIFLLL